MDRRKYLAAIGLTMSAGLAGCGGETGDNGSGGGTDGGGAAATTAAEESTPAAAEATADETDTDASETETAADDDGEPETEDEETTTEEDEETTTEEETETSSDENGDGSSVTDSGETDVELQETTVADGLSLDSAEFYSEDGGITTGVRGEVTNTSDSSVDYLEITALFYDSEGTRLGDGLDNLNDFAAGETYQYDALYLGSNDASEIASYSLEASSGF